jgi:hypothetical protein
MTGWLSVDPMADKYPNISPYAYCAWNPVKLVDPDGKRIKGVKYKNGKIVGYSKRALRNGVKEYIDIRSRTESGRKNIERMLKDTKNTYRIKIVDKPLYKEIEIGKYKRLVGYRYKNTIFISTDYNKYTESVSAVVVPMECGQGGLYETISLANRIVSPDDILELSETDRKMLEPNISCYGDIPLEKRRRDEAINAIGAHEEGHVFGADEGSEVMEIECNALKEYENL